MEILPIIYYSLIFVSVAAIISISISYILFKIREKKKSKEPVKPTVEPSAKIKVVVKKPAEPEQHSKHPSARDLDPENKLYHRHQSKKTGHSPKSRIEVLNITKIEKITTGEVKKTDPNEILSKYDDSI